MKREDIEGGGEIEGELVEVVPDTVDLKKNTHPAASGTIAEEGFESLQDDEDLAEAEGGRAWEIAGVPGWIVKELLEEDAEDLGLASKRGKDAAEEMAGSVKDGDLARKTEQRTEEVAVTRSCRRRRRRRRGD